MYSNKFVVVVIVDGKIQQETQNGICEIPFGSHYTVRLRNKNSKRAICKLSIDNESVGDFIIPANSHIDIECPTHVDRKFRFAALDSEAAYDQGKNAHFEQGHHGLIKAEFALERELYHTVNFPANYYPFTPAYPGFFDTKKYPPIRQTYCLSANDPTATYCCNSVVAPKAVYGSINNVSQNINTFAGVTVEGDKSNQSFTSVYFEHDYNWSTLTIKLRGYNPSVAGTQSLPINFKIKESDLKIKELELELAKLQKIKDLEKQIQDLKNS